MTATVRGISVEGRSGKINKDLVTEYTAIYKVATDDRRDGPAAVRQAFGIPNVGDLYNPGNDFDGTAVVISKEARQGDSPYEWEVEVTYSNDIEKKPADATVDPFLEPPEFSVGFQTRKILVPGYYNDPAAPPTSKLWEKGILNPAGEEFIPQPEADIAEPLFRVTANTLIINMVDLMNKYNAVNALQWGNAPERTMRFQDVSLVRKTSPLFGPFWRATYTIAYRFETWDIVVMNQGTYYWESGAPSNPWSTTIGRKQKRDESGNPVIVNLTTAGALNTSNVPTFTRIRFYREINFANTFQFVPP